MTSPYDKASSGGGWAPGLTPGVREVVLPLGRPPPPWLPPGLMPEFRVRGGTDGGLAQYLSAGVYQGSGTLAEVEADITAASQFQNDVAALQQAVGRVGQVDKSGGRSVLFGCLGALGAVALSVGIAVFVVVLSQHGVGSQSSADAFAEFFPAVGLLAGAVLTARGFWQLARGSNKRTFESLNGYLPRLEITRMYMASIVLRALNLAQGSSLRVWVSLPGAVTTRERQDRWRNPDSLDHRRDLETWLSVEGQLADGVGFQLTAALDTSRTCTETMSVVSPTERAYTTQTTGFIKFETTVQLQFDPARFPAVSRAGEDAAALLGITPPSELVAFQSAPGKLAATVAVGVQQVPGTQYKLITPARFPVELELRTLDHAANAVPEARYHSSVLGQVHRALGSTTPIIDLEKPLDWFAAMCDPRPYRSPPELDAALRAAR